MKCLPISFYSLHSYYTSQCFLILANVDNRREEKKIEQPNGKLVRRKVMRRKRPLPTVMSPLPYQGNRRVSSQQNHPIVPNYNLTVKSPTFLNDATNPNEVAVKKLRRKKIPVTINSSKVVTYRPKTTPMMPVVNASIAGQENALNRTEEEKRCMYNITFFILFKQEKYRTNKRYLKKWCTKVTLTSFFCCFRQHALILFVFFVSVLSLFTIVTFKNEACASTAGSNGTCYSSSDCSKLGGTASGTCASGFGVCCLCKLKSSYNRIISYSMHAFDIFIIYNADFLK